MKHRRSVVKAFENPAERLPPSRLTKQFAYLSESKTSDSRQHPHRLFTPATARAPKRLSMMITL
jgi:hypothetical protein